MSRNAVTNRYANNTEFLPHSGKTFDEIRNKATGLHFAKEMLTITERELLAMLEDAIELIDNPPPAF